MSVRVMLAALAVVSVPIAVNGAEPQAQTQQQKVNKESRRTCTLRPEPGSRINTIRTCRNPAEVEAARQEQRRTIDRIQTNKVSFGR
ncbi:MAG TPA: hypothetical protein VEC11_09305 [Allosphingosinicella sp.]|nr:hypothetical protein [Allosphingosinicella sp.]